MLRLNLQARKHCQELKDSMQLHKLNHNRVCLIAMDMLLSHTHKLDSCLNFSNLDFFHCHLARSCSFNSFSPQTESQTYNWIE